MTDKNTPEAAPTKGRPGRPRSPHRKEVAQVALEPDMFDAVQKFAEERRRSVSDVLREATEDFVRVNKLM